MLVRHLEDLGYSRYWLTEHHTSRQSGSPLIAAAVAAASSRTIRVGTAGVMIRYLRPLRVAKDARLLQLLHPGRMDLGIIGGPALSAPLHSALAVCEDERYDYRGSLTELALLLNPDPPAKSALSAHDLGPYSDEPIELWIGSTSIASARLAGSLGVRFAYHHYIDWEASTLERHALVDAYRTSFRPSKSLAAPYCVVVCYGSCAESELEARTHWSVVSGVRYDLELPSITQLNTAPDKPSFIGTPDQCYEQLHLLAEFYGVSELVVHGVAPGLRELLATYELLAGTPLISKRSAPVMPLA